MSDKIYRYAFILIGLLCITYAVKELSVPTSVYYKTEDCIMITFDTAKWEPKYIIVFKVLDTDETHYKLLYIFNSAHPLLLNSVTTRSKWSLAGISDKVNCNDY